MSNQMENNTVETMDDLTNTKLEMLHYRPNGLSYKLGFLGIAFSVLAAFVCLNSFQPTMLGFLKILMNIAILLFGFMFCENAKNYSKNASISLCVIGGVCVLRIFWIPLSLMTWYNKWQDTLDPLAAAQKDLADAEAIISNTASTQAQIDAAKVAKDAATEAVSNYSAIIDEAGTHLGGTIMGSGVNWIWQSGYIRGVIAIVFLCCAAVAFISAGVIGIIKNNEYNKIKDIK